MSRTAEDTALLQAPIPLAKDGVQSIVDFWHDATHEVRNLLANECDIIFQCKVCDNFFRSLLNFISHKRSFCRTLYGIKSELNLKVCAHLTDEIAGHLNTLSADEVHVLKKPRGLLKRTSIVGMLNKRIEHATVTDDQGSDSMEIMTLPRVTKSVPLTTFDHGEQVLKTMPEQLMQDSLVPKVRTALVMPQDNNVQYREMNLRRRNNNQKDSVAREFSTSEVEILYRLENSAPGLADFAQLRCLHPSCINGRSFFSMYTLAYHISVKHNHRSSANRTIQCFICGSTFGRYSYLVSHLEQVHENIYNEHQAFREASLVERTHKKYKKTKAVPLNAKYGSRSRSLSPLPTDYIPDDITCNGCHGDGNVSNSNGVFSDLYDKAINSIINAVDVNPVGCAKLLNDDKALTTFRSNLFELNEPLAACQQGGATLNQILRFLQISSKLGSFGEIKMKRCKQVVLDCIESIIDRVCELEGKDIAKNPAAGNSNKITETMKNDCGCDGNSSDDADRCSSSFSKPSEDQLVHNGKCSHIAIESFEKKCTVKVKSDVNQIPYSGTSSLTTTDNSDIYKTTSSCKSGSPVYINENSFNFQNPLTHEGEVEGEYRDDDYIKDTSFRGKGSVEDLESETISTPPFKCRPTRQRRKPNWIDGDSFMTISYGKKKRRRDCAEDSGVKDEFTSLSTDGLNGKFANYNQSVDYQASTLIDDNQKTGCSSESSSGRASYCSIYSYDHSGSTMSANSDCSISNTKTAPSSYFGSLEYQNFKNTCENDCAGPSTSASNPDCDGKTGEQALDPAKIPVYLTEAQRELLFSFIIPICDSGDQLYKCTHCSATFPDIKEGRLHAVDHIRIIRLRCTLCGSGSFYCSAMRDHLRLRQCPKLALAPKHCILSIGQIPCMSRQDADSFIEVVDKAKPGRIAFTPGKIISSAQLAPHMPDPMIEQLILGSKLTEGESFWQKYDSLHIKLEP